MLVNLTWTDAENKVVRQAIVKADTHGGVITIGDKDIVFDLAGNKLNFFVSDEDTDIQQEIPDLSVDLNF